MGSLIIYDTLEDVVRKTWHTTVLLLYFAKRYYCGLSVFNNLICPDGQEHSVTFLWTYNLMCAAAYRILRRKSSVRGTTPPESPRMLPPAPSMIHSSTTLSRRPRSGPAGLHSYTGSAPTSRSGSRLDVTELPPGVMNWQDRRAGSAPNTPMASPPTSPRHWSRRASNLVHKRSNT